MSTLTSETPVASVDATGGLPVKAALGAVATSASVLAALPSAAAA